MKRQKKINGKSSNRYASELTITDIDGPENSLEMRIDERIITVQPQNVDNGGVKSNSERFLELITNDEAARNLTYAALVSNGEAPNMEKILVELYSGTFGTQSELHKLIKENESEIYRLISEGITNLGVYLGEFTLGERTILPILMGRAIIGMQDEQITPGVESKMLRILRNVYSPHFNRDPQQTMEDIRWKIDEMSGKKKELYEKLLSHYTQIEEITRELSPRQ